MPFEPFTLSCSTCGAQLRVTNPDLVGTIANCPKCGSLVQIAGDPATAAESPSPSDRSRSSGAADQAGMAVGSAPVDSDAITRDAVEAPEQIGSHAPGGGFAVPPDAAAPTGAFASPSDTVPPNPSDLARPPAWQSERTQRARHIAMVVAIAACGLIVTASLFGWFVSSWNRQDARLEAANVETPDPDQADPEPDDPEPVDSDRGDQEEPSDDPDSESQPDDSEPGPDDSEAPESPGSGEKDAPADDSTDAASQPQENPPDRSTGEMTSTIPDDLLGSSPLAESPLSVTPEPATADDGGDDDSGGEGMRDLPEGLKQYTPFLGFEPEGGETAGELGPPPTADEIEIDAAAEEVIDPMLQANPLPEIDIERAMGIEMAFASRGYPLVDFALVISQLTGVPIEIDWVSFDLVDVDVRAPVPTSQAMESAGTHLAQAAAAVDAEVLDEEAFLRVSPTDERFHDVADRLLDLDDFGEGRHSAVEFLHAFLGEPDDDQAVVRRGTTRTETQLSLFAVEALRRMRGLPGKVSDGPFSRWAGPVRETKPWKPLQGGDAGPPLEAAVTMAQLIRQTARRNQATCLINWADAVRRQMAADRRVMPHNGPDAAAMLAETLEPLGLQIREVSTNYWWLGTEATYDRLPVLVWTQPLGDGRTERLQRIAKVIAEGTGLGPEATDEFPLVYDPESDRGLMLLPRFLVRQLPEILEP